MTPEKFLDDRVSLYCGDSREVLKSLPDNSIDSIVTDPPYALVSIGKRFGAANAAAVKVPEGKSGAYARASKGFIGKQWDTGETAFATEFWAECLRVLKPGGHVVAFSGTRTYHRMACAIEDVGFEIRDQLSWMYGSGFPKSHNVAKNLSKQLCGPSICEEWEGWGTALKPAQEPICLARKPLSEGTVAANVLRWRTGALNIGACRVGYENDAPNPATNPLYRLQNGYADAGNDDSGSNSFSIKGRGESSVANPQGRWPANVVHDGSEEVVGAFPETQSGMLEQHHNRKGKSQIGTFDIRDRTGEEIQTFGDSGSAARFFYTAKADADDRLGSKHPTVKPVDLMQWLVRLVTPKGGIVLDPFGGTGTTAEACYREGIRSTIVEREIEYQVDIRRRMALCLSGPDERQRESIKAKNLPIDHGPLFGGLDKAKGGRQIYGVFADEKSARRD